MTRLCGGPPHKKVEWSDGPFFRVIFKSNECYDSTGFKAKYQFVGSYSFSLSSFSVLFNFSNFAMNLRDNIWGTEFLFCGVRNAILVLKLFFFFLMVLVDLYLTSIT